MTNVKAIVKFKKVDVNTKAELVTGLGATILGTLNSINAMKIVIPQEKISELKRDKDVEYVEESTDKDASILAFSPATVKVKEHISTIAKSVIDSGLIQSIYEGITSTIHDGLSGLEPQVKKVQVYGMSVPWNIAKVNAPAVWATGNRGNGIKGCIINTGIDYNHPSLKDNYKGGYNFLNDTDNPLDDNGHGTHVAGIAAAKDSGDGIIGVAPEMSIYACKVLDSNGSGSYADIVSAIQWCIDHDINLINMSLGGTSYSQALNDICNAAYNKGILIIAAAGNAGGSAGQDTITYPAKFDSVIAVGATDSNDNRASFSSVGPKLEVSAPGVGVTSTVPTGSCRFCTPGGTNTLNGTSMASPHVFGGSALILASDGNLKNTDIRTRLDNNSVDLGTPGRDPLYGFGRLDTKAAVDNNPPPTPTPPPVKKYSCSGSPEYRCIEDPNGKFNSIEECQAACKPPQPGKRYDCINGICVPSDAGLYPDLASCQSVCRQSKGKFSVQKFGNIGVMVMKTFTGTLTAEEACVEACKLIKEIP